MRTDYQNLSAFEASLVAFIAVGVLLVATIVFSGLTTTQQNHVLAAFEILDVHTQLAQTVTGVETLVGMQEEFFNQFYIAFNQVAAMPPDAVENIIAWTSNTRVAYEQFLNFSDQITFDYNHYNQSFISHDNIGRVAGAHITAPELQIPYSFAPLEWQPSSLKLINVR